MTRNKEADWAHHKPFCAIASKPNRQVPGFAGEPPLRRHLRHWTSRFDCSMRLAVLVALDIANHPENLDKKGLIIHLHPRPHANVGSRFSFVSAEVEDMSFIEEVLLSWRDGDELLKMHKSERKAARDKSGGDDDFATCLVFASNEGKTPLPGGEHGVEMRCDLSHHLVIYIHLSSSAAGSNL